MKAYILDPTETTPRIMFDPDRREFLMEGSSRPEDVRSFYYPILEWFKTLKEDLRDGKAGPFTKDQPLVFNARLTYFNSSSAKFLFDIFFELKNLSDMDERVEINWFYDPDDEDMKEAGLEMEELVEISFNFIEGS